MLVLVIKIGASSIYGNNLLLLDCKFHNHITAYGAYPDIAPEDDVDILELNLNSAAINVYVGIEIVV